MEHGQQKVVKTSGKSRIIIVETSSDVNESNSNDIIVTGSHQGSGIYLAKCKIKGAIGNDAGKGKQDAGIAGFKVLDEQGIPAAAVSNMTAQIGNGDSTYEQGKISAVNEAAGKLGIIEGMSAKEAADKMLDSITR